MVLNRLSTTQFAESWLQAWNSHDLKAVLAHFSDNAVFTSPVAAEMLPHTGGVLVGKLAIRDYWTRALERIPDLRFEIVDVYTGVDTLVINYRNQLGRRVCEVLTLRAGLAIAGHGTYLSADAAAAAGGGT